jgi:cytochrome c oxidase cbb3-type subunit 3
VENVLSYVLTLSGRLPEASRTAGMTAQIEAGRGTFKTLCAACHGPDGKGNPTIGAPNLTDSVWLHGGEIEDIRETITHGRLNHMPAHAELLGETKVRLLAAYVLNVSEAANPGRAAGAARPASPGQPAPAAMSPR